MAGELPSWYRLIKAAQYMRVAPWELADKPAKWTAWAEQAMIAEARHRKEQQQSRKK